MAGDEDLWDFDARYELTRYPAELLWGPVLREDAMRWLAAEIPTGDQVSYQDHIFLLRRAEGKVYLPCRPEVFFGLPENRRRGVWHAVRADFPNDAFVHVRHIDAGTSCDRAPCPVEELASPGSWGEIAVRIERHYPGCTRPTGWR